MHSNTLLRKLYSAKVWAHRVNTLEELQHSKSNYSGVELDLVFQSTGNQHYFDIHHPPDPSSGLPLSDYLKASQDDLNLNYWLDLKNLDMDNKSIVLAHLDSVVSVLNIDKGRVIVESRNPEALSYINKGGYQTSYYLPSKLYAMDQVQLQASTDAISLGMDTHENKYISADYRDYTLLKKYFPGKKKLIWFSVYGSENKLNTRYLLYQILMDETVDVLLIPSD